MTGTTGRKEEGGMIVSSVVIVGSIERSRDVNWLESCICSEVGFTRVGFPSPESVCSECLGTGDVNKCLILM